MLLARPGVLRRAASSLVGLGGCSRAQHSAVASKRLVAGVEHVDTSKPLTEYFVNKKVLVAEVWDGNVRVCADGELALQYKAYQTSAARLEQVEQDMLQLKQEQQQMKQQQLQMIADAAVEKERTSMLWQASEQLLDRMFVGGAGEVVSAVSSMLARHLRHLGYAHVHTFGDIVKLSKTGELDALFGDAVAQFGGAAGWLDGLGFYKATRDRRNHHHYAEGLYNKTWDQLADMAPRVVEAEERARREDKKKRAQAQSSASGDATGASEAESAPEAEAAAAAETRMQYERALFKAAPLVVEQLRVEEQKRKIEPLEGFGKTLFNSKK